MGAAFLDALSAAANGRASAILALRYSQPQAYQLGTDRDRGS